MDAKVSIDKISTFATLFLIVNLTLSLRHGKVLAVNVFDQRLILADLQFNKLLVVKMSVGLTIFLNRLAKCSRFAKF